MVGIVNLIKENIIPRSTKNNAVIKYDTRNNPQ